MRNRKSSLLLALALFGCSSDPTPAKPPIDLPGDAGVDATTDSGTDAGTDPPDDAGTDAAPPDPDPVPPTTFVPTAVGKGGAAATVDQRGTWAAIETLKAGGNAIDAAVAAAA